VSAITGSLRERRCSLSPLRVDQFGDLVEALGVARHQHQQHLRWAQPGEGFQQGAFLALAGAGGQQDLARAEAVAELGAQGQQGFRRGDVELDVAGDLHVAGAQGAHAVAVGLGLGADGRQVGEGVAGQAPAGRSPGRTLDRRALTMASGVPVRRQPSTRLGHSSVSIRMPIRGWKWRRKRATAHGKS
jgi:hypothetical protein